VDCIPKRILDHKGHSGCSSPFLANILIFLIVCINNIDNKLSLRETKKPNSKQPSAEKPPKNAQNRGCRLRKIKKQVDIEEIVSAKKING
jgi:hypothetical protein